MPCQNMTDLLQVAEKTDHKTFTLIFLHIISKYHNLTSLFRYPNYLKFNSHRLFIFTYSGYTLIYRRCELGFCYPQKVTLNFLHIIFSV